MLVLNLIPPSLVLTLCTIGVNIKQNVHSAHRVHVYFCVLYGSQNKQLLLPDATLTDGFLFPRSCVLTGRSSYIFQYNRFVFKRSCHCSGSYSSTSDNEVWVRCRVCPHVICGWKSDTCVGFSPSTSVSPRQYHSTSVLLPSRYCFYQKDKRAKPRNLQTKQRSFGCWNGTGQASPCILFFVF
jgi:hypothetical protein